MNLRCSLFSARLLRSLAVLLLVSFLSALSVVGAVHSVTAQQTNLQLKNGDSVCIIGNTLAERMQHEGWLEAMMQTGLGQDLVFRNLGFSGDTLDVRLRSKDFGSPDQWLEKCQADVVFAFFGYNESFDGQDGLPTFKRQLTDFVKNTKANKYNGQSNPQIVLFSPIYCEDISGKAPQDNASGLPANNGNLVPLGPTNERLAMYTAAMKEIAAAEAVTFVDLFNPTKELWAASKDQHTINGVHLNETGNLKLAAIICKELFNLSIAEADLARFKAVQAAVADKNWHWFHRYRTTDGYSTYGGRADLRFTNGQTNREVVQRELEVLDFMTAERDKKVWAVAAGKDYAVDDSKSPAFIPVISNKPGDGPNGEHIFLSGAEAISQIEMHENMQVNLFASEEQFPELASPVQLSFDTKGRLWVAVWPTYPHWQPKVEEMNDKLVIFTDTDGDGTADTSKVFADKLHNPTGFEFWNGGVIVAQIPDLLFLKDTDGDDVADVRIRLLHGLDSADTHHAANSFVLGPGGGMYFQEGTFHHSQMERVGEGPLRVVNAGVYRFDPRTFDLDAYISYGFANPHGHVFDDWGQDFMTDGTGNVNYYAAPFSGHLDYPDKHSGYFPFFKQWVRPAGATELLSSEHFPEEFQGNYMIANVIGFQGILHYEVNDDGSGFSANEVKPILKSTDPNFRPVDIEVGPDGAIYLLDWQNPIIGHMQHNLRDPNRDKVHGRVYRVTYKDRPLLKNTDLTELSIPQLLDELKKPNGRERYRARLEISGRNSDEVIAATKTWVANLKPESKNLIHDQLEALWVTQQHNNVDVELLKLMLVCEQEPRARAAATRVLCYCRNAIPDALSLLRNQVNDSNARVRLEAVRALSFIPTVKAAEAALDVLNHPMDKFIDYCLKETMRSHRNRVKQFVTTGEAFAEGNPAGLRYIVADLSTTELIAMRRNETVNKELLSRPGIFHEVRLQAAKGLAQANGTDPNVELLNAIDRVDKSEAANAPAILADLTHVFLHGDGTGVHGSALDTDFSKYRDQLNQLASSARKDITRQVAFATLIAAEKSADRLWKESLSSPTRFRDFVNSLAIVDDPTVKAELAPKVTELLQRVPMEIQQQVDASKTTSGQYIRIELPGNSRTLTLAEVQVMSGGRNIAASGKATQSTTSFGGNANLAIDGNTDPVYSKGSQTHTDVNRPNPWWELDLGTLQPLDGIVIFNRNEQDLGGRLNGFTLKVLDGKRATVFESKGNKAPKISATIPLQGDPIGAIREATIAAAVHIVPGENSTFESFANFIVKNESRTAAVRGMSRLPKRAWVDKKINPLVGNIISQVSALSAAQRTQPAVIDEITLGKKLATALPVKEAKAAREQLNDLGVNVVVLRPIPHRMQFDRVNFFVEAGKPFQLILDNTDIMPHNVVITKPGSYAKVGIAAEQMASSVVAGSANYVPNLPEVLFASKMLQPAQLQRMDIVAPTEPGEYPYVCTYPGHWRRMYGVMHVVEDINNAPVESLVPTVDSEISARPFVREWAIADLDDLSAGDTGRNFERGRALFIELSCAQCHKMGAGDGGEVGPNLIDLQDKYKTGDMNRAGVLKSLIEPSETIEEKYRTWIIQDIDGKVHTGVIAERTDEQIRLLANPLDNGKPVTIPVDDIDEELESKISIMPQGLLNTCTKQEILDLLMYIESAGKRDHPSFGK